MVSAGIATAVTVLASAVLSGPNPGTLLEGPPDAPLGKLVVLRAVVPEASEYRWLVGNPPADDNHQECSDRLIFSTGIAGEYTFFMSALVQKPGGPPGLVVAKHTVRVGGTAGFPPPPVIPPTAPPPAPATIIERAEASARKVGDLATAASLSVLYSSYALAGAQAAGAKGFIDGFDPLIGAMLGAVGKYEAWKPFLADMDAICDRLTTVADLVEAYKHIAAGLLKASK
jgi:hypothetical protein